MTCREKLMIEHPDKIDTSQWGGCDDCPSQYGYLPDPEYCGDTFDGTNCDACWDREIPKTDKPHILDSGERREFDTGAVRDIQEGKGRCDLLPLRMVSGHICDGGVLCAISSYQETGNTDHLYATLELANIFPDRYTTALEVSKHFEEGAKKYGEHNWKKGIPTHCYVDSAVRHYLKYLRGDNDEPHDRAFVWNILCCIWTCANKPELNDYGKESADG